MSEQDQPITTNEMFTQAFQAAAETIRRGNALMVAGFIEAARQISEARERAIAAGRPRPESESK